MARSRWQRLLRDLRRRRLFSTGAMYAVGAWAVVQASDIALGAFGAPPWVMRAVIVAAFAGFPVALVLAWVFDIGRGGVTVTPDAEGAPAGARRPKGWWVRPLIAAPVLAAIVGGSVWLWTSRLATTGDTEFTRQMRPDELPVVAVLPLENLTGRKELAWVGQAVTTLVRDDLARSRLIATVSMARTRRLVDGAKDTETVLARASDAGITHVLTGELLRTPSGLTLTSRLTDLRRNVELGANRQEGLEPERALAASTAIASVVKQGLGLPGTEKVDVFAANFASHNIAAYEAFIAGMQNFVNWNYADARTAFQQAVDKAPDFAMARYRLGHTLGMLGDTGAALEQVRQAKADSARLGDREKAYIGAAEAYFARDYARAEERYRALLKDYPYESEARTLLMYVLTAQDKKEEALVEAETLAAQDPRDEIAWSSIADLTMKLGRFDETDEAAAQLLKLAPDNPNTHVVLGDAQFMRGQFDQAQPHYAKALQLEPTFGDVILQQARAEVMSGTPQPALERLSAMTANGAMPGSLRITAAMERANLLRALGRCPDAVRAVDAVQPLLDAERIRVAYGQWLRAMCALDAGDAANARRLAADAVAHSPGAPTRYLHARGLAEIAAGDAPAVEATLAALRAQKQSVPGDFAEAKVADALAGQWRLARKDAPAAVALLRKAVDARGYEYDVYKRLLAQALHASGEERAAREAAREAATLPAPAEFRMELEPGRRQAQALLRQWGG